MKRIHRTFFFLIAANVFILATWLLKTPPKDKRLCEHDGLGMFSGRIQKSPNDDRCYRYLTLNNGLKVLLVSDEGADQSAASMSIQVGSYQNPEDRAGLAHFLEHMLFLGTKRFPQPDEYSSFLSSHGGQSNAFTASEQTNFYFSVNKDHLEGALDRFAQFFISPLFNEEFVNREVNAVDSEHHKNLTNEFLRVYQVHKESANKAHPFSRFSTGSLETLMKGIDAKRLRADLIAFYNEHYSAERMGLVVLGKESLDQLEQMAKRLFASVPNRGLGAYQSPKAKIVEEGLPREIFIEPIQDLKSLQFTFVLPGQHHHYANHAGETISHLIGHEGKGSLLSHLKAQGWATALSAGTSDLDEHQSALSIQVNLTQEGLSQIGPITNALFDYFGKIKAQKNLMQYFDELKSIAELGFRYQPKSDPEMLVMRISGLMAELEPQYLIKNGAHFSHYDQNLIDQILAVLTPEKMTRTLVAKQLPAEPSLRTEQYQVPYLIRPLDPKELTSLKQPASVAGLHLPEENPYLLEKAELIEQERPQDQPRLLHNQEGNRLWHMTDVSFGEPKANYRALITSPIAYDTPKHAVMSQLLIRLIDDQLTELAYPASLTGMKYSLNLDVSGIELQVTGFPEKLPLFFAEVAKTMKSPKLDREKYEIFLEDIRQTRENNLKQQSFHLARYEWYYLLNEPLWHHRDYLAALDEVSFEELEAFSKELFRKAHLEGFAHGNVSQGQAKATHSTLTSSLSAEPHPDGFTERTAKLERGKHQRYAFLSEDGNSAISLYFQGGQSSLESRVKTALLSQIMEKPVYHQLRTIEQLGYIVWSGATNKNQVDGFFVLVQSSHMNPKGMTGRILSFLQGFRTELAQMSEEDFEKHRQALIELRRQEPKNLMEANNRHWSRIAKKRYDFDFAQQEIKALERISKDDIVKTYESLFLATDSTSLALEAWGKAHAKGIKPMDGKALKAGQSYFPNPSINLPH